MVIVYAVAALTGLTVGWFFGGVMGALLGWAVAVAAALALVVAANARTER